MSNQQQQQVRLSWLEWLLGAIHTGFLLFAFYCIFNAYALSDNGDEADARLGADILRVIMFGFIGLILSSAGTVLVIRDFLQRRGKS